MIGGGTVRPDPAEVEAILIFQRPLVEKNMCSFLDLIGYYRKFVPNFVDVACICID